MNKFKLALTLAGLALVGVAQAQVPQLINYQGRVVIAGTNFNSPPAGQFKFALVQGAGPTLLWKNDGSAGNTEPAAFVALPVVNGLYSVLLGDTAAPTNMVAIPNSVFANSDVRLRVWFGTGGAFQQLSPDQRIVSVGYAVMAATVPDGSITAAKLAPGTITSNALASTLGVGSSSVDGRFDVFHNATGTPGISLIGGTSQIITYGDDGLEQARLSGTAWGELVLNNSQANNNNAVHLSANAASGGFLALKNTNGSFRAYLSGNNAGGSLTLYQADGGTGVFADGDASGSGLIQLRSTNGSTRINLYGKSPSSGGGEVSVNDDTGDEVVEIIGESFGGRMTLKDESQRSTVLVGSSVGAGGFGYLYTGSGAIGVEVDGDSGGGGYIGVRNTNGSNRVVIDGYSTAGGGGLSIYDGDGTETIEMLGAESTGAGGQILMRSGTGVTTIQLDSDAAGTGYLAIYDAAGVANIILDGDVSGDGRITTQVLQITGGSDLSENFEINGAKDTLMPGMIVSIDPKNVGELVLCQQAFDKRVAGIVSGAGGVKTGMLMGQAGTKADGKHPVALTGRVYCWVDADAGGAVEAGDLITTSSTPGHGMKVSDSTRASGAIIGKAMSSLEKGKGLVLILVSLQ